MTRADTGRKRVNTKQQTVRRRTGSLFESSWCVSVCVPKGRTGGNEFEAAFTLNKKKQTQTHYS